MQKYLRILSGATKAVGIAATIGQLPFIPPQYGPVIFAGASLAKDALQGLGDLMDDGKANGSFKPEAVPHPELPGLAG